MRNALSALWIALCILAASGMLATLLGLKYQSWPLAIVGALLGIPAGWLFGKIVRPTSLLIDAGD